MLVCVILILAISYRMLHAVVTGASDGIGKEYALQASAVLVCSLVWPDPIFAQGALSLSV